MKSWADVDLPPLANTFAIPPLKLFDTASQSIKEIERKIKYRIYVCGITPYDATHLGHAATYLTFDLINRYLRLTGATVEFVQNITDIDDPLLERAARDGSDWRELATSQVNLFRGDMVNLHVIPPDHYIGVVEAMTLIIEAIQSLVDTGNTYFVESDLYFEVHADSGFGSRSHLSQDEMLRIFSERGGDMVNLHVIPPDHYIGVVEAMTLIIEAIQSLVDTGNTYFVESDLYFEVHADSGFGSRSHLSQDEMLRIFSERGGDPKRIGKRNPLDALLWRGERPGEPSWDSPFGPGRPGWHIECSAIALRYLVGLSAPEPINDKSSDKFSIDIQGGGSDLIFPHHEMSASQSVLITGKEFASHYVHAGMIGLDGEKMSKSLGNLVFVSTLISHGVSPAAIRWALLSSHFTEDRMWSQALLDDASLWIDRLRTALSRVDVAPTVQIVTGMINSLSDNLDTVGALHIIKEWIANTEAGESGGEAGELSRALDTILGIAL